MIDTHTRVHSRRRLAASSEKRWRSTPTLRLGDASTPTSKGRRPPIIGRAVYQIRPMLLRPAWPLLLYFFTVIICFNWNRKKFNKTLVLCGAAAKSSFIWQLHAHVVYKRKFVID